MQALAVAWPAVHWPPKRVPNGRRAAQALTMVWQAGSRTAPSLPSAGCAPRRTYVLVVVWLAAAISSSSSPLSTSQMASKLGRCVWSSCRQRSMRPCGLWMIWKRQTLPL